MSPADPHGLSNRSIPVAYAQLLVEILAERGIDPRRALSEAKLRPELLEEPDARITPRTWTRLALTSLALSNDAGFGCEYGLRLRPTAHGILGYAVLTAATLRDAIETGVRFSRMRLRMYAMRLSVERDDAVLEVRETQPIPVLRQFFYECFLIGIAAVSSSVVGLEQRDLVLCFDWPEPDYHARYRARLPAVRFGCADVQLRFPVRYLDQRLPMADPIAHRQAVALCEREHSTVELDDGDVAARVRAELVVSSSVYPDLKTVATRLVVSPRTLKRQLQRQGTSFQVLLNDARRRDALALLEHSDLGVEAIAERLGYTNPANFTRAFRRWMGCSPTDHRTRSRAR